MKALRWLTSQSYGSIYVNFGDLISVRQYFDRARGFPPLSKENGVFAKSVQEIAVEAILEHQKHLVVPIFPLIATVILSKVNNIIIILFINLMHSYMVKKLQQFTKSIITRLSSE